MVDALENESLPRDLVLLGMKPTTTEQQVGSCFCSYLNMNLLCTVPTPTPAAQVRHYFMEKGASLALCQIKKSKDSHVGLW